MTSNAHISLADSTLTRRVAELVERLQAGEEVDLKAFCSDSPEQFEQLEMLLPTLQAVVDLEQSLAGHSVEEKAPTISPPPGTGEGLGEGASAATGLLGDFRILREIGRGGMGVVYEAEQISLGRHVALKVLPFAAMLDRQQLARFKNEARAAATLKHPNIVSVYSIGCERGVHFFAMELIEGQSLAQVVEQMKARSHRQAGTRQGARSENKDCSPPLHGEGLGEGFPDTVAVGSLSTHDSPPSTIPPYSSREYFRTIAQLGIQAAEALDHAHQNGVLHRDIKPANLLVECSHLAPRDETNPPRGAKLHHEERDDYTSLKLWITDFGLARMEQDAGMTMTGDLLGTLRYMSPEQALAKRVVVDHRSDIYSLGVTLYEMLTLQPAFTGDDRQELLRQIAFDEPRPPRQINARIPQDLETIVLKAIRKDPEHRYATAQNLADDLHRFLNDQPIKAKPPTWCEQLMKWSRRHPAAIWAAVLVLLATTLISAASAVLITSAYNREAAQRNLADARLRAEAEALERANTESARAKAVSDYLLEMIFSPSRGWRVKGSQYTVREMLDDYAAGLGNQLAGQPEVEAQIRLAFGCSYLMLGAPNRGEPHFKRAIELRRKLPGPPTVSLAECLGLYGTNLYLQRRYDAAELLLRESLEIYRQRGVRGTDPMCVCRDLQLTLAAAGRHDEADRAIEEAWAEMQDYDNLPPEFAQFPTEVADTCAGFAYYYATIGREKDAAEFLRRATLAQERLQNPIDSFNALQTLARMRLRLGDLSGYREACAKLAVPLSSGANDASWEYWDDEVNMGRIFTCCLGPNAVDDPNVLVKQAEECAAHNRLQAPYLDLVLLGSAHYRAGHYQEAAQYCEESIAQYPSDPPPSHGTVLAPQLFLAMAKWQMGQRDDARSLLREIEPAIEKSLATPNLLWTRQLTKDQLRREAEALIEPKARDEAVENESSSNDE
jgi:serine/threonine protein kinase